MKQNNYDYLYKLVNELKEITAMIDTLSALQFKPASVKNQLAQLKQAETELINEMSSYYSNV